MANREENLKKINDELEMLSDDELEQIAGGTVGETVIESEFLYELGYGSVTTGVLELWVDWKGETAKVEKGWAKFGVECHSHENARNDFYIDGKKVSRDDAFKYAANKVGKPEVYEHNKRWI